MRGGEEKVKELRLRSFDISFKKRESKRYLFKERESKRYLKKNENRQAG
jgi:hypothetical protein